MCVCVMDVSIVGTESKQICGCSKHGEMIGSNGDIKSRPDRGRMPWKKAHRGRRNPQRNWGDLEYTLMRARRHGEYGMRGQLQKDGWAPIGLVADRIGVREEDIRTSIEWQQTDKVRLEARGNWVRALQGHSSDSGLQQNDFTIWA